jgi:hypothetical protein
LCIYFVILQSHSQTWLSLPILHSRGLPIHTASAAWSVSSGTVCMPTT